MNGSRISFAWMNLSLSATATGCVFADYEPKIMYLTSINIGISSGLINIGAM